MTDHAKHIGTILEVLHKAAEEHGHVFLYRGDLLAELTRQGITDPAAALYQADVGGYIVQRGERVYLRDLEAAERAVEENIGRLLDGKGI